jgi:LysR family tcuABC transcriptional regulator
MLSRPLVQPARRGCRARVSVGLAPTTAAVLGLPLMHAMRQRYPDVRLHMVESLSGHLTQMLNARQLDLAVLFETDAARRWSVTPLLEEKLYLIRSRAGLACETAGASVSIAELADMPLDPADRSRTGCVATLDAAFARAGIRPVLAAEIDSLALLMDAVDAGLGATLQPWAAVGRFADADRRFHLAELSDPLARRPNVLCSLSDDELSPAALAARVVLADCARERVLSGLWVGARLIHHDS